jgi:hypothetical protein
MSEFIANISEYNVCCIFMGDLRRWDSVFQNVGIQNSDAGESPKRKNTTFPSFKCIKHHNCSVHENRGAPQATRLKEI